MPSMGSGAAEGLQDVLQRLFLEATAKQQQRQHAATLERQQLADSENTRRWDADHALRQNTWNRTVEQDRLKAEQDAAEKAAQQGALDTVLNDPTVPASARTLLRLGQHNLGSNLNVHALEAPDAHAAHVQADADTAWGNRKRELDYVEQQRRSRPNVSGRLVKVDPTFPAGVQTHLAQIRARHGDFESALGEFVNSIERHQQAYPNFAPQKAIAALQGMYTGGGRPPASADEDPVVDLVRQAMGGGRGAPSGGRGSGPGPRPQSPTASPSTGRLTPQAAGTITAEDLQRLAQRRGTSVEQERARAVANGYTVQ
jgi:hypothetical protein